MTNDKSIESRSHEIQKTAQESYIAVITEINMIGEVAGWSYSLSRVEKGPKRLRAVASVEITCYYLASGRKPAVS